MVLIRAGQSDLEDLHAGFVARALTLDDLTAREVMIHRLDVKFLDIDTPFDQLIGRVGKIPHTRIPVCRGDIDELVGVVYLHDIVKNFDEPGMTLEKLTRPPVIVPENLTLDKAVNMMREERTQILMVVDEYGGTAGLITLEDVVEEVFGVQGIGWETLRAIEARDVAWIVAVTLLCAIVTTASLVASDIAYGILDPRVRESQTRRRTA